DGSAVANSRAVCTDEGVAFATPDAADGQLVLVAKREAKLACKTLHRRHRPRAGLCGDPLERGRLGATRLGEGRLLGVWLGPLPQGLRQSHVRTGGIEPRCFKILLIRHDLRRLTPPP